jgi:peroxiredoxin
MPTLSAGATAPNISLSSVEGKPFSLDGDTRTKPVVAAFFKVSCPTCQYAFPYLERIYKAYPKDKVTFVGVSQNPKDETTAFTRQFGVTFPVLLDDTNQYPASNAYGLTTVPSIFVVSPASKIEFSSVGWIKPEIELLNKMVADAAGVPVAEIFKPGEQVVDYKAG